MSYGEQMMLPPDDQGDFDRKPYDVARGDCPSCGSGEVTHLMIGMPTGPEVMEGGPGWVEWVGCVHPGYNRSCGSCGATWTERLDA